MAGIWWLCHLYDFWQKRLISWSSLTSMAIVNAKKTVQVMMHWELRIEKWPKATAYRYSPYLLSGIPSGKYQNTSRLNWLISTAVVFEWGWTFGTVTSYTINGDTVVVNIFSLKVGHCCWLEFDGFIRIHKEFVKITFFLNIWHRKPLL